MSDEQEKIQWHPAFCDAMELTLRADADVLTFEREFNLSSKPLQVDLLVIRKADDRSLSDAIGKTLRRYNLFEYKSPGDALTIDDFYKVMAYGCLYKVLTSKHVNEVPASEITLTMVREKRPDALFRALADEGTSATSNYPGIYQLDGGLRFAMQVIVTDELPEDEYVWLRALTRNMNTSDARRIVTNVYGLKANAKEQREAEGVFSVATRANENTFAALRKEDAAMDHAFEVIFKDEIEESDLRNVRNLMDSMNWSSDVAMAALKIAPEKRERYARLIAESKGADSDSDE